MSRCVSLMTSHFFARCIFRFLQKSFSCSRYKRMQYSPGGKGCDREVFWCPLPCEGHGYLRDGVIIGWPKQTARLFDPRLTLALCRSWFILQKEKKKKTYKEKDAEACVIFSSAWIMWWPIGAPKPEPTGQHRAKLLLGFRTIEAAAGSSAWHYEVGSVQTSRSPSPISHSYSPLALPEHLGSSFYWPRRIN